MAQTVIGGKKETPIEPTILPSYYKHSIIESRYIPHTSLLSGMPGSPTKVEWYLGAYGRDEQQRGFEPGSIETYSSYKRINNLICKLDPGNGNYNFDPEKGQVFHQLTGHVLFDLAPNIGNLFIRDVGDGRAGLYTVTTQPEPKNDFIDKCYYFEASLTAIVTEEIMNNLNAKVIQEFYYSKDNQINGGNAVLSGEDISSNKRLYELQIAIIDEILANNYFADESTIIVPNELDDNLYDPYLAKFLSMTIPARLVTNRRRIEVLNANYYVDSKMQEPLTIWDMFYRGDFSTPKRFKQQYYVHDRRNLLNTRMYGNVFFSKMNRAIVIHKDDARLQSYRMVGGILPGGFPNLSEMPTHETAPWDYFFGDDFYEFGGTEVQKFIWTMFREGTMFKKDLIKVLEKFWDLTPTEKLYMGGIYLHAISKALVTNSDYV